MPVDLPRFGAVTPGLSQWWRESRVALAFLTRLPVPLDDVEDTALGRAARGFPVVGLIVGLSGGLVYAVADILALPVSVSALLAVGAMVLITGGLHEDGLADTADGVGGGRDREQALAIMRDSRIGSYGVIALLFALSLRVTCLAALAEADMVMLALVAAAAGSRAVLPVVMFYVPPARTDGLSHAAGPPVRRAMVEAAVLGGALGVIGLGILGGILGALLVGLAAWGLVGFLAGRLGGQTGDVLGAVQQTAEIVILLVATLVLR
jgi:adenosylcobinamide-GDP ribazoletransferase